MKKLLVSVDGSECANHALIKAQQLGEAFNSEITVLHVIDRALINPYVHYGSYAKLTVADETILGPELKEESEKLLNSCIENIQDYDGQLNTLIKVGRPWKTIVEIAEKENYDLIIMGSRGLGVFTGAMLGSVSHKVVNKSKVSVLIVK